MIQRRLLTHAGRVVWLTMEIFFLHTTFFFNTPSNTRKKNQKYPYIYQWISNSCETYKLMYIRMGFTKNLYVKKYYYIKINYYKIYHVNLYVY